jgi:hypothetical protein
LSLFIFKNPSSIEMHDVSKCIYCFYFKKQKRSNYSRNQLTHEMNFTTDGINVPECSLS